jgi:hypothetical protein
MGKKNCDIYGANPDGGAADIAASALKLMKGKGVVTEPEKTEGKGTSHTTIKQAKP